MAGRGTREQFLTSRLLLRTIDGLNKTGSDVSKDATREAFKLLHDKAEASKRPLLNKLLEKATPDSLLQTFGNLGAHCSHHNIKGLNRMDILRQKGTEAVDNAYRKLLKGTDWWYSKEDEEALIDFACGGADKKLPLNSKTSSPRPPSTPKLPDLEVDAVDEDQKPFITRRSLRKRQRAPSESYTISDSDASSHGSDELLADKPKKQKMDIEDNTAPLSHGTSISTSSKKSKVVHLPLPTAAIQMSKSTTGTDLKAVAQDDPPAMTRTQHDSASDSNTVSPPSISSIITVDANIEQPDTKPLQKDQADVKADQTSARRSSTGFEESQFRPRWRKLAENIFETAANFVENSLGTDDVKTPISTFQWRGELAQLLENIFGHASESSHIPANILLPSLLGYLIYSEVFVKDVGIYGDFQNSYIREAFSARHDDTDQVLREAMHLCVNDPLFIETELRSKAWVLRRHIVHKVLRPILTAIHSTTRRSLLSDDLEQLSTDLESICHEAYQLKTQLDVSPRAFHFQWLKAGTTRIWPDSKDMRDRDNKRPAGSHTIRATLFPAITIMVSEELGHKTFIPGYVEVTPLQATPVWIKGRKQLKKVLKKDYAGSGQEPTQLPETTLDTQPEVPQSSKVTVVVEVDSKPVRERSNDEQAIREE